MYSGERLIALVSPALTSLWVFLVLSTRVSSLWSSVPLAFETTKDMGIVQIHPIRTSVGSRRNVCFVKVCPNPTVSWRNARSGTTCICHGHLINPSAHRLPVLSGANVVAVASPRRLACRSPLIEYKALLASRKVLYHVQSVRMINKYIKTVFKQLQVELFVKLYSLVMLWCCSRPLLCCR